MSNTVLDEGYAIQSSPRYLAEWENWQRCIVISFKQHAAMKPREFSSDVLYTTEQEADIHGIAFGQHLIDGEVEGRSVTDMKVEKRLGIRRFRVQFPTTVSDHRKHNGLGLMLDLSRRMLLGKSVDHDPRGNLGVADSVARLGVATRD